MAPTLLDIAGIPIHPQMTGTSFKAQLIAAESGRIDANRDHALLGKERHDIGRTDGDRLSVSYPSRAIRTDDYLYVHNFKPNRWPGCDPQYGLLNCDSSPTKTYLESILKSDPEYRFYEMSFGKRPQEELFHIASDPDCINNLANQNFIGSGSRHALSSSNLVVGETVTGSLAEIKAWNKIDSSDDDTVVDTNSFAFELAFPRVLEFLGV